MGDHQNSTLQPTDEQAQRAWQAEKQAALARLATGMVHDFNNLLMIIVGHAELGLLTSQPNSPARAPLERILNASEQATEFCRQIIDSTGHMRLDLRPTDLGALLQGLQTPLTAAASHATLRWQLHERLPAIDADPAQLTRLINHLVANADEALPPSGGTITLGTGAATVERDSPAWLPETGLPSAPCVFLEVADTGAGMDRATVNRMFDPFFSTRRTGRGLGLAAVLGIARAHRAAISVDSQPGQGTRIRVFFPPSEAAAAGTEFAQPPAWRGSGRALVIDADEPARTVAGALLEHFGFDTLLAADMTHAATLLREHTGGTTVVLLAATTADVGKSLAQLRELMPGAKILLIGADAASSADGFVQKPLAAARFAAALRSLLG
ncbi:MAG TPA: ATP-binding protein [Pirellulales bacterium]|nr:ATP-binding protein [Pirellulales bacterium]